MGFAQELVAARAATTGDAPKAPSASELLSPTPLDGSADKPAGEAAVAPTEPGPVDRVLEQPAIVPKAKVRIGSHEFASVEEAIAYAQDLELSTVQQDAYKQGLEAAKAKEPVTPEISIEEEIENELFENPKAALKKYKDHILKIGLEAINAERQKQDAERKQQEVANQTWQTFYEQNADLAEAKRFVQIAWREHQAELAPMSVEKGFKVLAEKTRALLAEARENSRVSKELPSGPAITTSGTGGPTTPPPEKPKTMLDFISQVNKHRKRTAPTSA